MLRFVRDCARVNYTLIQIIQTTFFIGCIHYCAFCDFMHNIKRCGFNSELNVKLTRRGDILTIS